LSAHTTALRTHAAGDKSSAAEASVPKSGLRKVHDALSIENQVPLAKGLYGILKTRWADLEPMPLYPAFRGEES
jgi:hypothetical protein